MRGCSPRWSLSGFCRTLAKGDPLRRWHYHCVRRRTANEEQRRALENIALGKLGGLPFEILATTFSAVQETRFVPFEFRLAGRNSAARIGDSVAFDLEPVKNPVSGEPEFVRIEHATGFIFKGAEVVSARDSRVSAGTINFRYSDKAGFVTEVHYQN